MRLWVIALAAAAVAGPTVAHGRSDVSDYQRWFGVYMRPPGDEAAGRAAGVRELRLGGEVRRLKQPFRPWKTWTFTDSRGREWGLSKRPDTPGAGGGKGGACR